MFWLRMVIGYVLVIAGMSAALFGSAGHRNVPQFQAYIGLFALVFLVAFAMADPDLLKERMKPGPGGQDVGLRRNVIPLMMAHWVIAGVDVGRFHWWDSVPRWLEWTALAIILLSMCLSMWASKTNRFFSSVARIQRDRGHHVVTGGPYRYIRHPGYAAAVTWFVMSGIALGSWVSMVPLIVGGIPLFYRRLRIEEALLFAELEGYREYAQRVPYRLVPGVW